MPGSVASAMVTEVQGQQRVHPVFELGPVDGTTYLFAEQAVVSTSAGLYLPYLSGMSGFSRVAAYNDLTVQSPTPTVTVYDRDRTLQKAIGGPAAGQVVGSAANCWLRSAHVVSGSHFNFFTGIVVSYRLTGDRTWEFKLSPDLRVLDGLPKIPSRLGEDFPTAPIDKRGEPLWIVYGKHASPGLTDTAGRVAALPAEEDSSGDVTEWVLGYGQMSIQRIYTDRATSGTIVEETGDWGFYVLERGNHRYQMATYTGGSTNPTKDTVVRVDCWGLNSTTPAITGAHTPFENPITVIRNFLTHFAYGDGDVRASASWESETGKPIATSILDAADDWYDDREIPFGAVVFSNQTVRDVFNRMCKSAEAVPLFTDAYEIGAIPVDYGDTDIYHDDRHVVQYLGHALEPLTMATNRSKLVSALTVNYNQVFAENRLAQSTSVEDASLATTIRDTFDIEFGDTSVID